MDQRDRQSRRSASRCRPRAAATPGRVTVARTSSPAGRTIPSATDRARCSTSATKTTARSGGRRRFPIREEAGQYVARHGQGYSRFEHASHGISLELCQYVAPGRPDQDLATSHRESLGAHAAPLGHRVRRVGARRARDAPAAVHRDRDRRGDGRAARAQSLEHRIRGSRGLRGPRRATARLDGRPDGVPRPQRRARRSRLRSSMTCRSRIGSAPVSIRAAPCRPGSSSSRTPEPRSSASSARRPRSRRPAR